MISRRTPGTTVASRIANLEVQIGLIVSTVGTSAVAQVPFSFASPPTMILHTLFAGSLVYTGAVLVIDPFDPGSTLELGTSASPGLVLSASESRLEEPGQYESDLMVPIPASDMLILTLSPGLTLGRGILLYRLIN